MCVVGLWVCPCVCDYEDHLGITPNAYGAHTHTHTYRETHAHTQTHTQTHRHRHIHTDTYTHTDTHTLTKISSWKNSKRLRGTLHSIGTTRS